MLYCAIMKEKLQILTPGLGFDRLARDDHAGSTLPTYLETVLPREKLDIYDNQYYVINKNLGYSAAHNNTLLSVGENAGKVYYHNDSTGAVKINRRCDDQNPGVATMMATGNSMVTVMLNEGVVIASNSSTVYIDMQMHKGHIIIDDPESRVITPSESPRGSINLDWVLSRKLESQGRHDNLVIHNNHYSLPKGIPSITSLWDETGTISKTSIQLIESVGGEIVIDAKGEVSVVLPAENYMCKKIGVTFKQIHVQNSKGLLSLIPVMVGVDDPNPKVDLLDSPSSHT